MSTDDFYSRALATMSNAQRLALRARLPRNDFGEGMVGPLERWWNDLTGATARTGLRQVARRVRQLEDGERIAVETLQQLAAHATGERAKPFEAMCAAIQATQADALARLDAMSGQVEELRLAQQSQHTAFEAVRDTLHEHVERLERTIAALPEALRADLRIELDNLRNTPDAATALLYGAETFAGAVARSLEEAQ